MLRYAITEGRAGFRRGEEDTKPLETRCAELARGGVDFVLIREKHLGARELAALGRRLMEATRGGGTRVLIAGRVDVAAAIGAAGVHLGASPGELRVQQVRMVMPEAFVSVACHTVEEVRRAREDGASAVLFAPVFGKRVDGVEVVAGVGLGALREACEAAGEMPVFALGGVTDENATDCVEAGAAGVAGIRMFFA